MPLSEPTSVDILRQARALISPPGAWCQAAFARGKSGRAVRPDSPNAVSFCLLGAFRRVQGFGLPMEGAARRLLRAQIPADQQREEGDLGLWNDAPGRTQAEVLALFDLAIAAAEREAADGTL